MVESGLTRRWDTGNQMEDVLPVCADSADERCFHLHISIFAAKDGAVAVDSSPFGSVQAVSIMQFARCRQGLGQQVGLIADAGEFWRGSLCRHRLDLQVGVGGIFAHLQTAIYELTACRLLAVDGDDII